MDMTEVEATLTVVNPVAEPQADADPSVRHAPAKRPSSPADGGRPVARPPCLPYICGR